MEGIAADLYSIASARARALDALREGTPAQVVGILQQMEIYLAAWLADAGSLTTRQLAALSTTGELYSLIEAAGLDDVSLQLRNAANSAQTSIVKQLQKGGIRLNARLIDETALDAMTDLRVRQVADSIAAPIAQGVQRAWVDSTFAGQDLRAASAQVLQGMQNTLPSVAETQVGTALSSIDSAITVGVAKDQDPSTVFLYLGPSDRVTRATCAVINGKWGTREQYAKMNNGQLPGSVLIVRGGWRCRHHVAPLLRNLAVAQGLPQITDADIQAFNAAGRR